MAVRRAPASRIRVGRAGRRSPLSPLSTLMPTALVFRCRGCIRICRVAVVFLPTRAAGKECRRRLAHQVCFAHILIDSNVVVVDVRRMATTDEGAGIVRDRLRAALPEAMKARNSVAVAALRSALGALDSAEAVDAARPRN